MLRHCLVSHLASRIRHCAAVGGRLLAMAAIALCSSVCAHGADWVLGMEELHRLDRLPVFRGSQKIGSVSSYDRTGGNDDGFSGRYSFVRREERGLVLADLQGPGIIYRIWTPTPTDDWLEFYFDGEADPRLRIRFRDLFLGGHPRFPQPLASFGAGGFVSYVPLPFARSCKVVARAERIQFYQINYALYPPEAPVETFTTQPSPRELEHQEKARQLWTRRGSDLSAQVVPAGASLERVKTNLLLHPGQTMMVYATDRPGRLAGIRLSPADALGGKARDLLLRIAFDGEAPAVNCPLADFFGYAWGEPAMKSLLVGTADGACYSYFPMPFDRSARIEIVSERRAGPPVPIQAEVAFSPVPRRADEGEFYAVWRRENPTRAGVPFTFIDTAGHGHVVGVVLQAQGTESGNTLFFEGDDQATIDGELVIHGTGSEDFFNGGWYDVPDRWEQRISFPLSGCLGYQKHLGRTGGYRLFLGDAVSYHQSVLQTIEHGGEKNSHITDYCGMTYVYSERRPTVDLTPPALETRAVQDFREILIEVAWQTPILGFSFDRATLSRGQAKIDGQAVRYLSYRVASRDWAGDPFLYLSCELPVSGQYDVFLEGVRGPECGQVQLFRNEAPVGTPVDLFDTAPAHSGRLPLGKLALEEGKNNLMLKIVGRRDTASAFGMDLVRMVFRRTE